MITWHGRRVNQSDQVKNTTTPFSRSLRNCRFTAHLSKEMENGGSIVINGETKQPFLIGVAGGTASGKVSGGSREVQ